MVNGWITRLADDERRRDAVRSAEVDAAAQKVDLVRRHGQGSVVDLRETVARDVEAFRHEFPGDQLRDVVVDDETGGGFAVRKSGGHPVSLRVAPRWDVGTVSCRYQFTSANGLPAREERFDLVLTPQGDDAAQFKHHGSGQVFATVGALSEYLLTPVFTGRPR